MDKSTKVAWRDEIVSALDKSQAIFLARYSGMTVEELTNLRRELRKSNAEFKVVKNSIAKKAISDRKEAPIAKMFAHQTAVIFAYGDAAAAAKSLSEQAKDNEKLQVVGGFMETAELTKDGVKVLASLPPREVLLAKIIGSLIAPHRGLLGVMQGVPRAMVSVLNQIKETKTA